MCDLSTGMQQFNHVYDPIIFIFLILIFRCLYACGDSGKSLARETFLSHRHFYHSVLASYIEKDLHLS